MTVKELIEKLKELPQDLPVYFDDNELGPTEIVKVTAERLGTASSPYGMRFRHTEEMIKQYRWEGTVKDWINIAFLSPNN